MTSERPRSSTQQRSDSSSVSTSMRLRRGAIAVGTGVCVFLVFANLNLIADWNGWVGIAAMWVGILGVFVVFVFARMTFEPSERALLQQRINDYRRILGRSDKMVRDLKELRRGKPEIGRDLLIAWHFSQSAEERDALERGFVELAIFQPLSWTEARAIEAYDHIASDTVNGLEYRNKFSASREAIDLAMTLIDRSLAERAVRVEQLSKLKSSDFDQGAISQPSLE